MERSNITEPQQPEFPQQPESAPAEHPAGSTLRKRKTLTISVPRRLEGLAVIVLSIGTIVFLAMSGHTLYQFPVPDSYRWYGDETQTWMLLGWKSLLVHGRMMVPVALESTLMRPPGLFLGSSWFTAVWYGIPQLIVPFHVDPVTVGRTVSFIIGLFTLGAMVFAARKLEVFSSISAVAVGLVVTTRAYTFACHSARYDIITAFGVLAFISFFALQVGNGDKHSRTRGASFAFWLGFSALMIVFTVSPHTGVLLLFPSVFIAWYFGSFHSVKNALALVAGVAIAFGILAGIYYMANGEFSIMGMASSAYNQSGAYISHLPYTKPFSWSAQSRQMGAKLYYLWHDAPAFAVVLPLIVISEIILTVQKRPHPVAFFLTISLLSVLIGSIYFESTLPYYIGYFVPIAALTMAAHTHEWAKTNWLLPIVSITSLILTAEMLFIWIPELDNAGRIGLRINEANTAAVQAAVEEVSREWEPGLPKPLILAQGPAVHELLRDTTLRAMCESFIFFPIPGENESTDSVIARAGVKYIIDYNKPMTAEYEQAVRRNTPIFSRAGPLLDRTVNYFHDTSSELDTLTMYEVNRQ